MDASAQRMIASGAELQLLDMKPSVCLERPRTDERTVVLVSPRSMGSEGAYRMVENRVIGGGVSEID